MFSAISVFCSVLSALADGPPGAAPPSVPPKAPVPPSPLTFAATNGAYGGLRSPVISSRPGLPPHVPPGAFQSQGLDGKAHPLVWDSMLKQYNARPGETTNMFTFSVTNTALTNVSILNLRPSCGCTVAKLPSNPWILAPGSNGQTQVTINFAGKHGMVTKQIYVDTSHGPQTLNIQVNVPEATMAPGDMRNRNMQTALADRQAVFKGDCASCHAAPTHTAAGEPVLGEKLYAAACGICHESDHRAAMVPDLKALKNSTDLNYWTKWISEGKAGSLMPGFSTEQGGPLSQAQIDSLAQYLLKNYPRPIAANRLQRPAPAE